MIPFVAGLSYKTAPVELREKIAVSPNQVVCAACRLKILANLSEVVLLSTCNRVEIYGVADSADDLGDLLNLLARDGADARPNAYLHTGADAAKHLFKVASGLDSMVLGETEITGQVKTAYEKAQAAKLTGKVTNRLFQMALQTAKAIRTRTSIGRGATSVGSVAVQLAEKIFDTNFKDKTVMIIGAGKMGEACIRHLAKRGPKSIIVANRTLENAQKLAEEFGGRAANYMDDGLKLMVESDIVVSSTGCPETILHRADVEWVMAQRRNRPLVLIDIAVPRDIDAEVGVVENVFLHNIDHLEEIMRANVRQREQDLDRCQGMIDENAMEWLAKVTGPSGRPAPAALAPRPAWAYQADRHVAAVLQNA